MLAPLILIIGGAGFIGSHVAHYLAHHGYEVLVLDKYIHDQKFDPSWCNVIKGDYSDRETLDKIFNEHDVKAVMHFASLIQVGESVKDPLHYYHNNVGHMITLLEAMRDHGVNDLIFSSTAAVYGTPERCPIPETHVRDPINPYGNTKYMIERMLEDCANAYGLRYCTLRYFNAAGGSPEVYLGEQHKPETHVIPLLLEAVSDGNDFKIFGTDYDTPDGTCIRDYLHVKDLATAHYKALEYLLDTGTCDVFNLGTGVGTSVRELIDAAEHVTGKTAHTQEIARRAGDPSRLVADPSKAERVLNWKAEHSSIHEIIRDAWNFFCILTLC